MVHLNIRLPGGTLKLKSYAYLRSKERDRRVPVMKLGQVYLCWWKSGTHKRSEAANSDH
ncbi:hypothetical protein [Mesorhizobium sp. 10J20-29]